MGKFELLEKEIIDMCKESEIEFIWSTDKFIECYILKFKKNDKVYSMTISEYDIYMKPFALLKAEVEHVIHLVVGSQQ